MTGIIRQGDPLHVCFTAPYKNLCASDPRAVNVGSTEEVEWKTFRVPVSAIRDCQHNAEGDTENARLRKQIGDVVAAITEFDLAGRFTADDIPYRAGDILRATAAEGAHLSRICAEVSHLRWLLAEDGPVMYALGRIELLASKVDGDSPRPLDADKTDQVYRLAGDAFAAIRTPSTPAQEGQTP